MNKVIRKWLRKNVLSLRAISGCYLFGSACTSRQYFRDVDVIVITKEKYVHKLMIRIKERFRRVFKKPLDIQLFHQSQKKIIRSFLSKNSNNIEIING